MSRTISAGTRKIGDGQPCFIIAEIGINHNGSLDNALKLIDAAADSGCDAVKFQLFSAHKMYPKSAGAVKWQTKSGSYSYDIFSAVQKNELPVNWLPKLKAHCAARDIIMFASAFDEHSLDTLLQLGMQLIKIGSSELTHLPLITHAAKSGVPIIISTGAGTLSEIKDAYSIIRSYEASVGILHCNTQYPTPLGEVNMNALDTLREAFPDAVIGFSDHTSEPELAPIAALDKGAKIIEKHITLDRTMEGPDHFFALEPKELEVMVKAVREAEKLMTQGKHPTYPSQILGNADKTTTESEQYLRSFAYRCILATKPIKKGERFTANNIAVLRPGSKARGLDPKRYDELLSCVASRDFSAEDPIIEEGVQRVAPITVLVTGIGSFSAGEGIVKALRAIPGKYRIVGTDMQALSAMTYAVDAGYKVPAASDASYISLINKIMREEKVDVLIPGSDAEMNVISHNVDKIERGVIVLAHPVATADICRDKWKTYLFLNEHGFLTPESYLPENPKELRYPLVVKDRFGGGSKNVYTVTDENELQNALKQLAEKGLDPIVQECVGSSDEEYTTSVLYGADGTLLSAITFKRTLYYGSTGTMLCEEYNDINDYAARVARTLPSKGSLNIQSRLVDGVPCIFEINPRFSGSTAARVGLGVNEVDMAIDSYYSKKQVNPQRPKTGMVVLRFFEEIYVPKAEIDAVSRGGKTNKAGRFNDNL